MSWSVSGGPVVAGEKARDAFTTRAAAHEILILSYWHAPDIIFQLR